MKAAFPTAILLTFGLAGCVSIPGYDSPGFKGVVLDSATKAPIADAHIDIDPYWAASTGTDVTTDASGRFEVAREKWRMTINYAHFDRAWTDARVDVSANGYDSQQVALLDLTKRDESAQGLTILLKRH